MKEDGTVKRLIHEMKLEMPGCVVFKHFDVTTAGIPDVSVTWGGRTVWIEVKHLEYKPSPVQLVYMARLNKAGLAAFVFFEAEQTVVQSGAGVPWVTLPPYSYSKVAKCIREAVLGA